MKARIPMTKTAPTRHARRAALWMAAVFLGTAFCAGAAPTARIIESGLYSTDPVADPPRGTPVGRYRLLERTQKVPLRLGVRFGFCAQFEGVEVEGKYMLTEIVRHPLMVQPSGIEVTGWNVPRMLNVENGRGIWCESHVLTQPHELVPGRWRFVVGDADADLVVEEFDAVPAGNP